MDSQKFGIPLKRNELFHSELVMPPTDTIQLKEDNERVIKRSILNLVTTKNLRAAQVLEFKTNETVLHIFEPALEPLTECELRGSMIFAMKQIRTAPSPSIKQIETNPHRYIKNVKPIINFFDSFNKKSRLFVILVFENAIFVTGDHYNETVLCQAIINFVPAEKTSIPIEWNRSIKPIEHFIQKDLTEPKDIRH
jgi:hypothetical protein